MAGKFAIGDHVWASSGGEDKCICHVSKLAHENAAGETKWGIQVPDGSDYDLTYREPKDRDEHGFGGTFWSIT